MFETKEGTIKPIIYLGLIKENKLLVVEYKSAPNPTKSGWWIPAPGLEFGEDPTEKASQTLAELGYKNSIPQLFGVESFVLPGGWHLIYHFICRVADDVHLSENIKNYKWITTEELENAKDIAHGKWEIHVGKSYLNSK